MSRNNLQQRETRLAASGASPGGAAGAALSDLPDRVVLLNLWAGWCGPRRREMPALDQLPGASSIARLSFLAGNENQDAGAARWFLENSGSGSRSR